MSRRAWLFSPALLVAFASVAAAQSGLQFTPDGKRTLVDKDVGGERWAIVRTGPAVSGNVYLPDGSSPQFVACEQISSSDGELTYDCAGAGRCLVGPCEPSAWTPIGEATLPESFFEPDQSGAAASSAALLAGAAAEVPGSGLQVLPDGSATLVNKDIEGERWSIARFADDQSVTGIVYTSDGASHFVWCEQIGVEATLIQLRCSGADSCREGPCSPGQWASIGDVNVPESFFEPPAEEAIVPENASKLELKWDFPIAAGVTAFPVVTDHFLYVGSWDGKLYALDPATGASKWVFDTESGGTGIQASVTLLEGGDLLFGDWASNVYRLKASTGELIWKKLVGDPAVDHIWSAVSVGGERIFVGIASHSDNPCTNGRTVALDLASGEILWERQNVPDRVCKTDTAIACDDSSDCPEDGECVQGRGAGVTATPTVGPGAEFVYVNAVGCYTFPSIGDSDSVMKLDAATGETIWLNRVQPPEQFGACSGDPSIDCGTDAMCGAAGPCQTKGAYHDFGFLNGPLLIETKDSSGDPETLLISGSKDGTLYALHENDGEIAWKNVIVPTPVSPGFAGFGLFNGAVAYENGRLYAALNQVIPATNPAPPHLMSFSPRDGEILWSTDIPASWSSVGVDQGVLFAGNNDIAEITVHDAATGHLLNTLPLPATSSSRTAIVGDRAYVAYGIISGVGGIRAYGLP